MSHSRVPPTDIRRLDSVTSDREEHGVRVVEHACAVLLALARADVPRGLRGFAEELAISKTTLQRVLVSLQRAGFVAFDSAHQCYSLTNQVLTLAAGFQRDQDIITVLRPHMDSLRSLSGETVTLSVAADNARLTIAQLESPHDLRLTTDVGRRYPLVRGATGRVLLSLMEPEEMERTVQEYVSTGVTTPVVEDIVVDADSVLRQVATTRQAGYATSYGEWVPGGAGVSVPIIGPAGQRAALSLYGPESRLTRRAVQRILPSMRRISELFNQPNDEEAGFARE